MPHTLHSLPCLEKKKKTHRHLLIRHPAPEVIILALRILQAILAPLHMLPLIAPQTLNGNIDQAIRAVARVIARSLPPHGAAQADVLDVLDFLAGDLRVVVGDHGAGGGVVGPGGDCLGVV